VVDSAHFCLRTPRDRILSSPSLPHHLPPHFHWVSKEVPAPSSSISPNRWWKRRIPSEFRRGVFLFSSLVFQDVSKGLVSEGPRTTTTTPPPQQQQQQQQMWMSVNDGVPSWTTKPQNKNDLQNCCCTRGKHFGVFDGAGSGDVLQDLTGSATAKRCASKQKLVHEYTQAPPTTLKKNNNNKKTHEPRQHKQNNNSSEDTQVRVRDDVRTYVPICFFAIVAFQYFWSNILGCAYSIRHLEEWFLAFKTSMSTLAEQQQGKEKACLQRKRERPAWYGMVWYGMR
jgi:hypothetical protein